MELKNKILCVIGLGKTGVAVANFLSRQGARVTLSEHFGKRPVALIFGSYT